MQDLNLKDPTVRETLERICRENGGVLRADDVVREAANPECPLHSYFEWDDSEAARQFRLYQAQHMIRHVRVTIEVVPDKEVSVRAYASTGPRPREYRPIVDVLQDDTLRRELLERAYQDLRDFRRRYAVLKELAGVFDAIGEVLPAT